MGIRATIQKLIRRHNLSVQESWSITISCFVLVFSKIFEAFWGTSLVFFQKLNMRINLKIKQFYIFGWR